jgi:hypothetical protein
MERSEIRDRQLKVCWSSQIRYSERRYFNWVEMDENVLLSFVPSPFTTVMIAIEIPAAIKPYSMAVAAVSSLRKALSKVRIRKAITAAHLNFSYADLR